MQIYINIIFCLRFWTRALLTSDFLLKEPYFGGFVFLFRKVSQYHAQVTAGLNSIFFYDNFHWKWCIQTIHQIEKLRFLGISRNESRLTSRFHLELYRGIWVCWFGGFRGCSISVESVICLLTKTPFIRGSSFQKNTYTYLSILLKTLPTRHRWQLGYLLYFVDVFEPEPHSFTICLF